MKAFKSLLFLFTITTIFTAVQAQNLTIREMMAEPSIAGMRVEGEKLSPDGTKVAFLWNAEGKMPRDLYLVPTDGSAKPVKILSPRELPTPAPSPTPDNKLNYGLETRDQFVRDRENQIGSVEWSPDSEKLVFTFGGDVYLLALNGPSADFLRYKRSAIGSVVQRRIQLASELVQMQKRAGVQENELFQGVAESGEVLSRMFSVNGLTAVGINEISDTMLMSAIDQFQLQIRRLESVPESYPQLRSDERVTNVITELTGNQNRLNVALRDYRITNTDKALKRFTKTQSPEIGARFLDNQRILYSQGGNVFVLNTSDATTVQLTREANAAAFISVGSVTPNKAGTMVAYTVTDASKQRQLVVPNYLPEYVLGGGPRRGWSEQKLFVTLADGSRDAPFEIKLPKPEGVSSFRRMVWTADGQNLIVDRLDKDTKRRQLFFVAGPGTKSEQIILVTEETDDKWQASLSTIFEPSLTNPGELFFGSERDGYNHLYLAKLNPVGSTHPETPVAGSLPPIRVTPTPAIVHSLTGGAPSADGGTQWGKDVSITQLTKGNWQVEWSKWVSADLMVYASTETQFSRFSDLQPPIFDATQRQFRIINSQGHRVMPEPYSPGMKTGFQISETAAEPVVLFERSEWNKPGELSVDRVLIAPPSRIPFFQGIRQLTNSTPDRFNAVKWTEPKFIEIASRDGKKIPAKIYLPPNHDSKKKYRMAIFVHGAGYLQNVINGWNNYHREFMFNDMLAKRGYVVLDIDYRGSAGYGRDWRTDVYDFLGGKDYDDHIDAIDHMVKNYGVDQKRIGVYGGSYGGFMAGMLAMRAPERIAAAAALRPVFDWKNYYAANPFYTAQRLGFPDKNPEAYKRSSPISYADKLERPLLILHGMADDNVHVQDSVQLIEKLIRLGKTQHFEAMMYPSENHAFVRPESWADEYERILAFFEKHLK